MSPATRILLVDDHEGVRRSLKRLVSSHAGFEVCGEACDGLEAVQKAKSLRPDLILMDVSMPRMEGLMATRIIRKEVPESRVIIVSQNDPAVVDRQAKEVDASAFVSKGRVVEDLIATISRVLDRPLPPADQGADSLDWLGHSGLGEMMRVFDWAKTPLGPIRWWPQSLKTAVNLMLNSTHPMWIGWGPGVTFLYNDAYIPVLSLAKHPWALGRPFREVWAEIWHVCGPLSRKVFEKGEATYVDESQLFMNRGTYREETYYSFSYSPIRDESGKIAGLFCPSTEVTPKVINARRLKTLSDLSASALLQKTTDAALESAAKILCENRDDIPFALIYAVDPDGRIARLDQRCSVSQDTELGRVAPEAIDLDESGETSSLPLAEVMRTGETVVKKLGSEWQALPLSPSQQPVQEAMILPLKTSEAKSAAGVLVAGISPARPLDAEYRTFYGLVAGQIATAMQNAKAAEEERKRLREMAELDRAKTAFFSNVSHEFRTPLTLMLGPIEDILTRESSTLARAERNQLELVSRNGTRLLRLVNTLLDFSRLEAGRMLASYQATDLPAFTAELASVFRSATDKGGVALEVDCPPMSEPVYVDPGMWEKIVLNLISNAFKFTFEGKIRVALHQSGNEIELRVEDTGVGIAAEEIPRLFDRFHRIENTRSRTHEGSGIGLALVQELVKLHGGTVRGESEPGKGTTFIVTIPLGRAHLAADRVRESPFQAIKTLAAAPFVDEAMRWLPDEGNSGRQTAKFEDVLPVESAASRQKDAARPLILLADDNADMRDYVARLLSDRFEVRAVTDGALALKEARRRKPDLVLCDVMMPNLDGYGLLRELRGDPSLKATPIIMLSARAGEDARVEGLERGADDYLVKPFSSRELVARVQTHLEMTRIRESANRALRESEARFRAIVETTPECVCLIDNKGVVLFINQSGLDLIGTRDSVPTGQSFETYLAPSDRGRFREFSQKVCSGARATIEIDVVASDGKLHRMETHSAPLHMPNGETVQLAMARDITDRTQAEEKLREAHNRLQTTIDSISDGLVVLDREWRYTYVSETAAKIAGVPRERMIGRTIWEAFPHTLESEFYRRFTRAMETKKSEHFEDFYPAPINKWLECHCYPNEDGLTVYFHDVTSKRHAEQSLARQRTRFEFVAQAAQVGFWFCDLPFDKLDWDARVKEHFWLPADADVTIGTFYERLHPDDREMTRLAIAESNRNDTPYDIVYRTVAPDGRRKWIRALGRTSYSADRNPIRFDGLTLDITRQREGEERERTLMAEAVDLNAKFRAIFQQTPVFAGILATDGTLLDANELSLSACGYKPENELGKPFELTGWWRGSKEVQEVIRDAVKQAASGEPFRGILPYFFASGLSRTVDFGLHPIRDDQGKIIFLHPTGVDVTDLKHAEEKYRSLSESLETEVRLRTQELEERNVEVLSQSEQLRDLSSQLLRAQDEERRHIARELHDSAGQILAALSMNLSAMSIQSASGDGDLAASLNDSNQLVQQLSKEIRTTSYLLHPPMLDEIGLTEALNWFIRGLRDRSGIDIQFDVAKGFPRLPKNMELAMFRLVQECLTNIHRHSGSKVAKISLSNRDGEISLQVSDQGRGIPPEKLRQIQTFGSGVGVRGMRERVRQLKGRMELDSTEKGTCIAFTFPEEIAETEHPATLTQ